MIAATLLCLALVLPTLGAAVGPTKLENPTVTPRTGTTATLVTFTVTYRSVKGSAPDYVRVAVGSTLFPMTASGSDWKHGVVFTVETTLPAGTAAVQFQARDSEKFVDQADGGTVVIGQPEPTPTPTPTPEPPAGGGSGSTSGSGGTSGSGSGGTASSGSGSGGSTSGGATSGSGTGGAGTGGTGATSGSGAGTIGRSGYETASGPRRPDGNLPASTSSETGATWGPGSTAGDGGTAGSGQGTMGGSGSSGGAGNPTWLDARNEAIWSTWLASGGSTGDATHSNATDSNSTAGDGSRPGPAFVPSYRGPFNGSLAALGLQGPGHLPTTPAVLVSTVAIGTWMAFMLFAKKRRDEQAPAPDEVLHAHAANGTGLAPDSDLAEPDPEDTMPRWRRPSLLVARKADPIRNPAPARPAMTFAPPSAGIPVDVERRRVRYTVAALLDRPDELRSALIGEVAEGDELQVEGRSGAFCRIICPDGRQGWIHRTALGEPIGSGRRAWESLDASPVAEAENALAELLAARGVQRRVV